MKLNNLIFAIFSLIALSGYGQIQEKKITDTPSSVVTEFTIKTSDINKLRDFDWSIINSMFEDNNGDQEIKLAFEYENPSKKRNSKPNVKNLKFEITGITEELPDLIEKSKKIVSNFLEINNTYN